MGIQRDWGRGRQQWCSIKPQCEHINSTSSSGIEETEGAITGAVTSSFDALDMSAQNNFTIHELQEQPFNLPRHILDQG